MNRIKKRITQYFKCCRGFSLPEVLVTFMIFSFLAAAINTVVLVGNSSWRVNSVEVELQQDLRQAMTWIRNDLQQTGSASLNASIPINVAADPVTYPDPDDDPAYYWMTFTNITFQKVTGVINGAPSWDANNTVFDLVGTNLQRTVNGGAAQNIAENIQSLQARRLNASSNIVEIALQAQKNTLAGAQGRAISSTLNFQVQLRN